MFNIEQGPFQIRPIQTTHNLRKLSLGNEIYTPLKIFLQKMALNFDSCNIAKTYVITTEVVPSRVWAYITLMNGEVILGQEDRASDLIMAKNYEAFPAVKIARLAVDKALQGKGVGKEMLNWAVKLVRGKISSYVGCRFLVVDAKKESISFYKKMGFNLFESKRIRDYPPMYLDLFSFNEAQIDDLSIQANSSQLHLDSLVT